MVHIWDIKYQVDLTIQFENKDKPTDTILINTSFTLEKWVPCDVFVINDTEFWMEEGRCYTYAKMEKFNRPLIFHIPYVLKIETPISFKLLQEFWFSVPMVTIYNASINFHDPNKFLICLEQINAQLEEE